MVTTKRKVKSVIADPSSLSTISSSFHSTLVDRRIKAIKSCGNWNSALLNGRRSRGPQWDFATASYHVPRNSLEYFTGVTRIDSEDDGSLTKTPAGSNPSSSMSSNIQKPQPMYLTSSNQAQERHMHSLNQQRQAPHDINMNSPRRPPSQQRTNHVRNFSSTTQGPYSSSLGHFPTPGSSDMPSQSFPGAPNSIIPPSLPDPKSMVFLQKPPQPQNFTNNQAGYPVGVGGPNYAQKINPPNNASGLLGTLNPSLVQQHPEHKNDGSLTSSKLYFFSFFRF
ncbi:hypothetical protein BY996DRAFT_6742571 [Phakopsora pachyrhizi]|nr:hypothetical protein BY996DRAFT_6742571 [Phakopsora pachyrhizi]